jgi:AraC-like DNA-binding protein
LLTLYVDQALVALESACRVVAVSRLVTELLEAAADFKPDYPPDGPEARLLQVLLDRLPSLEAAPLSLPMPQSPALRSIAEILSQDPSDKRTLEDYCKGVGMTPRTAARKFVAETGLTFGAFRQQLRLLAALERLGAGESVTAVAFEVGYDDVSAFIAAFKSALGETPSKYFATRSPMTR